MNFQKFIGQLPSLYDNWSFPSVSPKSHRFEQILEQVEGMTTANIMQLLNLAVDCMEPGEVYCEVGCLRGASLIGALLDHPDCMAYAVDSFSEFDDRGENLDKLNNNLSKFNLEEQVIFCNQDLHDFFSEIQQIDSEEKIGVYFYDADSNYRYQLLGLLLARPFLSNKALIILGGANYEEVQQATLDFISTHNQCQLLLNLTTEKLFESSFFNGIFVLGWDANITQQTSLIERDNLQSIKGLKSIKVEQKNKYIESLYTQAVILTHGHQYTEAEQKYKTFLLHQGNHADAWMNLGMVYYQTQRYQEAINALSKSLEIDPSRTALYYNFGLVLEKISNFGQAVNAYQQTIALNPHHTDAYNNLGNIFLQTGHIQEAEAVYRQAIKENPCDFGSYQNLGNVLMACRNWDEAIETYLKALDLQPSNPDLMHNLALAYEDKEDKAWSFKYFGYSCYHQRNYEEAVKYFQEVLALNQNIEARDYLLLGYCLSELNQLEASLNILQEGINLYPEITAFHHRKISILNNSGCYQEALRAANEAFIAHPHDLSIYIKKQLVLPIFYESLSEIVACRHQFSQGLQAIIERVSLDNLESSKNALAATRNQTNFYLAYQGYNDRDLQEKYGQFIHNIMAANYSAWIAPMTMPAIKSGKIRVGYLSDALCNSSASKWILGWLQNCDREQYEIYCYSTGSYLDIDATTQRIKILSDYYYHIPDNLEATCQQILKDQLHILVFLAIGMYGPTTQLASLRLAPIQCTTWGHPITSGLPTIDYFLSGELMEPENAQEHYTEKLVRLPNLGISYPKPFIPELTKNRSDFLLSEDSIIYLSCQFAFKYLPQYDYLFVEIAQQVPQAKFVFILRSKILNESNSGLEKRFRQRLHQAFAAANLNSDDYCVFLPGQDWESYTSLLLISDVFLDTLSFSGGHTSFDAVACNLPIVTYPGELMRGRQSYGILKMLGVTETIAQNEAEYIEIAVRLGLDPQWRHEISQRMSKHHTKLYDDQTCVKALEEFYQQVVQERLAQQETALFAFPKGLLQTSSAKKTVLHVGCGHYRRNSLPESFRTEEWQEVRLDIDSAVRPDIIGSITDMSAVPDESVDAVYSSHNLEHVYYHEVPVALAEFKRVLKPGGFVLIAVPDIQIAAKFVAEGNLEEPPLYISPAGPIAAIDMFYGFRERITVGNYYMAHKTAFTAESMSAKMQEAGFRNVEILRKEFDILATGYQ